MHTVQNHSALTLIAQAVVGYGVWLFMIPAIVLQCFGILLVLVTIVGQILALFPDALGTLIVAIMPKRPEIHGSLHISLVQPFLLAYSLFCTLTSLLWPIVMHRFHLTWKWNARLTLASLIGLCSFTYGILAIGSILLHKTVLPAVIFFTLTAIATAVAILANEVGKAIIKISNQVSKN